MLHRHGNYAVDFFAITLVVEDVLPLPFIEKLAPQAKGGETLSPG